ncbi:MAG: hypothetical protein JWM11_606 [Planctomycetaceae bacterium]|nr:hypothetical protein [Planctomycetaceae bacterium]
MQGMRKFELQENLPPNGSAKAVLLKWNGNQYVPSKDETVVVYDYVGQHGTKRDRGYCFLSEESGRWEAACGLSEQVEQWMP